MSFKLMKKNSDILIKVLSLGIGLAVGIVLIAKVFFELSYDSFYKDIDRVYTINTWYSHQGDEHDYGQVSGAVSVGISGLHGGGSRCRGRYTHDLCVQRRYLPGC